jgi:hypothetical protein
VERVNTGNRDCRAFVCASARGGERVIHGQALMGAPIPPSL